MIAFLLRSRASAAGAGSEPIDRGCRTARTESLAWIRARCIARAATTQATGESAVKSCVLLPVLLAAGLSGVPVDGASLRDRAVLRWTAPTSCPSEHEVAPRIEAGLAPGTLPAPLVVDVIVRRTDAGYSADVEIVSGESRTTRELSASSCDGVIDAVTLLVTMVDRQSRGDRIDAPEPAPTLARETVPGRAAATSPSTIDLGPSAHPDAPAPTSWRAPARGAAFADILLGFGGPPRLGGGLGGGFALIAHRVRAEAAGTFWFARTADIGRGGGPRVDVRLWTFGLRVGPVFYPRRAEIAVLFGAQAGMAHGRGEGVPAARIARSPWVSVGAYPTVLWPFHPRLALGLRGTVEGVLVRPAFGLNGGGARFVAAPVMGSLSVVFEVRFP